MRRTFRITVDGHAYSVVVDELEATGDNGAPMHEAAAPAAAPISASVPPAAVPAPQPPTAAAMPPVAADAKSITAPLAGVVRAIKATVGGAVAVGDKVAVIEAMKMKTEVIAKIAGKVIAIPAQVDEPVGTGQVLISLG